MSECVDHLGIKIRSRRAFGQATKFQRNDSSQIFCSNEVFPQVPIDHPVDLTAATCDLDRS